MLSVKHENAISTPANCPRRLAPPLQAGSSKRERLNNEVDIPKTGTMTQGSHLSLNFRCAQKKSREPAAAMMADNEGKNIAMAPSVPGGSVGAAA